MSYLLFLDESGHDHQIVPYEVRGGIALHSTRTWSFVRAIQRAEVFCFGDSLHRFGSELKGKKLLKKKRFHYASRHPILDDQARRKHSVSFLIKTRQHRRATPTEFAAFGQASLLMVREVFRLLEEHEAAIFACAIPRGVSRPRGTPQTAEYLRKDHVFLFERYFYFLEYKNEPGLIVMDQSSETLDRDFVRRMQRYFTSTDTGRYRTARIVPVPFFVPSHMTYLVQVADVCIYCINWGFRLPKRGMDAPVRPEVRDVFGESLFKLQFRGEGYRRCDDKVFETYGIVFVPDPYTAR